MKRAIMVNSDDNLATAMDDIESGDTVRVMSKSGKIVVKINVVEDIRFGHKFSLTPIKIGGDVIKYGEIIGKAFKEILKGAHAHVHNFGSARESMVQGTSVEGREE